MDDDFELLKLNLAKVGNTPEGRAVLWEILSSTGIYGINSESHTHMFQEGRRSVGVDLLTLLNVVDPKLYIKMLTEHLGEDND